jgi:lipopolysaccharide/colanic/teichoic acid biosynthesis glycosyltransferase
MPSRSLRARPASSRSSHAAGLLQSSSHGLAVAEPIAAPIGGSQELHGHSVKAARTLERSASLRLPTEAALTLRVGPALFEDAVIGRLPHVSTLQLAFKRALDVIGAAVGLIVAMPVLILLAVAVRLDSPGGALFTQKRVGLRGRTFRCYKLRTMCTNAEERLHADRTLRESYLANGYKLPVDCDPRVTRFGRFLRATSLDELPQLWNVLKGDMSLVGPRPVVGAELANYGAARDLLLSVRPGITGAWAVQGRSAINYPERADIELAYARSWTVVEDLRILWRTVGVVLQREGAH